MRKIPTVFQRDPANMAQVLSTVTPGCEWVLDGEGVPTRKLDGTAVMFDGGAMWKRREWRDGAVEPDGFVEETYDEVTGKHFGWVLVGDHTKEDRWHREARDLYRPVGFVWPDGTYELVGPKVQGNPDGYERHELVRHGSIVLEDVPRSFVELRYWLAEQTIEGVVWHHPDGRMAKLKRRDFPRV